MGWRVEPRFVEEIPEGFGWNVRVGCLRKLQILNQVVVLIGLNIFHIHIGTRIIRYIVKEST